MDYKYIEQLLDRYFLCQTSLEEEEILRSFFRQEEIPAQLLPYRDLFRYEKAAQKQELGEDFDAKVLAMVNQPVVKARRVRLSERFRPFMKAAALVAIVLTIGNAAQQSFSKKTDPIVRPSVVYTETEPHADVASDGISKVDSIAQPEVQEVVTPD
ncbi:MAG: hypothetical protein MJZ69_11130 [Bacteroidaceae bacterium]|nr:hypothetical protein [Candidatus Minthousia equi]MCQ2247318.1 hypothetical protein [Bacteroidaceae bacterium]MDO4955659.1 hypothetical protein [Bacteroidales bacterium]